MSSSDILHNHGIRRDTARSATRSAIGFAAILAAVGLAGCSEGEGFSFDSLLAPNAATTEEPVSRDAPPVELVERDIEAPEVFAAKEAGLWDGRPSLGGIWVAHPDVTEPERVLITNAANDKFVVGALFRRERDIPGPQLQISSDAAQALGMLAGAPAQLDVVALRKEQVPLVDPASIEPSVEPEPAAPIRTAALDPIEVASAALDESEGTMVAAAPADPEPVPPTGITTSASTAAATATARDGQDIPAKPFVQLGIFSEKPNADRTAQIMRNADLTPTIKRFDRDGKSFWRVIVGPARSAADQTRLLAAAKEQGYMDAYAVTN